MRISEKNHGSSVSKKWMVQWIAFALANSYSLDDRGINPKHIIQWVLMLAKTEGLSLFSSTKFKHTFYFLMRDSKYPMSLFLKLSHVEKLAKSCRSVDVELFEEIFDLFLQGSKKFATNPNGKELIRSLPSQLPDNREKFKGWFLTNINECFKMSSVIDFYIWLDTQKSKPNFKMADQVTLFLSHYLLFMKKKYTRAKYKKKRIFVIH